MKLFMVSIPLSDCFRFKATIAKREEKNHNKDLRSHLGVEVGTSSLAFTTVETITELEPKCVLYFCECYWGRAGQRLANFFTSLATVPEVFAKVNLAQFLRFLSGE